MSGELTIRPYQPGDEAKILETFNLVFREVCGPGYVDRTLEQWQWAYRDNPAGMRERLLVGYSADIDIILETHADVLRIPTEAVMENDQVYRYNRSSGTLELVSIEAGLRNWNFTEVTGNLEAGDEIVLSLDVPGLAEGLEVVPRDD